MHGNAAEVRSERGCIDAKEEYKEVLEQEASFLERSILGRCMSDFYRDKRVLITGRCGFIDAYLTECLVKDNAIDLE